MPTRFEIVCVNCSIGVLRFPFLRALAVVSERSSCAHVAHLLALARSSRFVVEIALYATHRNS